MYHTSSTPIEEYLFDGFQIYVKRDDLFAKPPAPPLAKVRGINLLIENLINQGIYIIGCFEASRSSVGQAVAAACANYKGVKCIVAYVSTKKRLISTSASNAKLLGAELLPLKQNFMSICYAQAKQIIQSKGGYMIPFGFEFPEAIESVAKEAKTVPSHYTENGTVVVCCGSGVTLAGIYRGLIGRPQKIIGVSSGRSLPKILSCLKRQNVSQNKLVSLIDAQMPYNKALNFYCPFSSDQFYDLKAWSYLIRNVHQLKEPILFWNVGGATKE